MQIELMASILMLASALMHAMSATILKSTHHKHAVRGISLVMAFCVALCFVPFVPLPTGKAWVFLGLSALIHTIYINLTIATLERGDLGLVYPFMRGLAPIFSAGIAFIVFKESLDGFAICGLLLVAGALIVLSGHGNFSSRMQALYKDRVMFSLAVLTALSTALYSIVDASGVRAVSNPWSYVVWFGVIVEPVCVASLYWRRRATFFTGVQREWKKGVLFGAVSMPGFAIAIYVFSLGPVARLAALRETSVLFAAILATIFLGEKFGHKRVIMALFVSLGLYLMH